MPDISLLRVDKGGDKPRLNVIFVHGLGGHPVTTWCHEGGEDGDYFWLKGVAKGVENIAVYTLGYPSDKAAWNTGWPIATAAVAVLDKLMSSAQLRASGEAPIALVCHSLGGLIIKKLVLTAHLDRGQQQTKGRFLDRIAGIVFLSTPHGGSIISSIASSAHWFASKSLKDLRASDEALLDLGHTYRDRIANKEALIRHKVYYETEGMWGAQVVTPASADPGLAGVRPIGVKRDHNSICKPVTEDDPVYEGILAFLNDEVLLPQEPTAAEKLDDVFEFVRRAGVVKQAANEGISELAVRNIVIRLGGEGIAKIDLVPWLESWVEGARRELGRRTNEDEAFEAARREAERRFKAGRDDASFALMAEFDREHRMEKKHQEERKRRRFRLLEEAVRFDELALDVNAIVHKFRQMADIEGVSNEQEISKYLFLRAFEYSERGDKKGENFALLVAIFSYREALKETSREHDSVNWATIQNNLGNALVKLGSRESGIAKLEEAVAIYCEALKERTRERVPLDWATTQMNLGNALLTLGERERGTAKLEEAVAAYREALKERTRGRVPLDWATTQMNLGNALARLGERERGTAKLEEAVVAYREALKERTRERLPLQWATTQMNLGNVLQALGERESGTAKLEEAVVAYREVLKEATREREPLNWATMQHNLGSALAKLGRRENATAKLEEAVVAYREALKERTRERVPLDWAMTQMNLGNALMTLGERERGTAKLDEGVAAYREALKEATRERVPLDWATTQMNLGNALMTLGAREIGTAKLEEAVVAYCEALKERTRERLPLQWANTQANLGNALQALGERESGTAKLEEAVVAYREALKELTRETSSHWYDVTQENLALCLALLEQRRVD